MGGYFERVVVDSRLKKMGIERADIDGMIDMDELAGKGPCMFGPDKTGVIVAREKVVRVVYDPSTDWCLHHEELKGKVADGLRALLNELNK